jgi:hypothetical protein
VGALVGAVTVLYVEIAASAMPSRDGFDFVAHTNVQWIGDTAVWPGRSYVTRARAVDLFSDKKVLFVGDSLSRRLAHTLYTFLAVENPTPDAINVDPGGHRTIEHVAGSTTITSLWTPLMEDYINDHKNIKRAMDESDFVFISIGLHDAKHGTMDHLDEYMALVVEDLQAPWPGPVVYMRTCPRPDMSKTTHNMTILDTINDRMRSATGMVIDADAAMRARDTGDKRIRGNTNEHFGPAGRVAMLQTTLLKII